MTVRLLTSPIWEIVCEAEGCREEPIQYVGWVESSARYAAERAGWSVRPYRGKGSRTAPDLCPAHARVGAVPVCKLPACGCEGEAHS